MLKIAILELEEFLIPVGMYICTHFLGSIYVN